MPPSEPTQHTHMPQTRPPLPAMAPTPSRLTLCGRADALAAALMPEGYSCFFRAKQPSPAQKFGFPADGIALFYRHARFGCSLAPTGVTPWHAAAAHTLCAFMCALMRVHVSSRCSGRAP